MPQHSDWRLETSPQSSCIGHLGTLQLDGGDKVLGDWIGEYTEYKWISVSDYTGWWLSECTERKN